MRLTTIVTIFTILFLSGCTSVESDLSIMSFHVRLRNSDEGVNSWENRKPLITWLLNKEKPDIIGLQSVDKNQLVALLYDLPDYRYIGEGNMGEINPGVFSPIFFKKKEFDLISKSQFWLSETPDVQGSKGWGANTPSIVSWAKLRNNSSGHIFYVFNTEFSDDIAQVRIESSKLLLQKIRLIADDAPVVITGTFFETPTGDSYHILTNNYQDFLPFWDAEVVAKENQSDDIFTYNGFSSDIKKKHDYIFVNGYFNVEEFLFFPIIKEGTYISNHFPILARLSFNSSINIKDDESMVLEQPIMNSSGSKLLRVPINIQK